MVLVLLLALGLTLSTPLLGNEQTAQQQAPHLDITQVTVTVTQWTNTQEEPQATSKAQAPTSQIDEAQKDTTQIDPTKVPQKAIPTAQIPFMDEAQKQADIAHLKKVLLNEKEDIHSLTPSGFTIAQFLSILYLNNVPTEAALLEALRRGIDINAASKRDKKTPFYYLTCYTVNPALFEAITKENGNALPVRDKQTNLQMLELLLMCGASPLIADEQDIQPINIIFATQDVDVLNLLVKYGWVEYFEEITIQQDAPEEASPEIKTAISQEAVTA